MGNFRKHSPRVFWSEAEVNILMEHYPSLSAAELLEKLPGRTIRVIQCKANGLGLSRTKPKKRTAEQTREAKRKHMAERRAENPEANRAKRDLTDIEFHALCTDSVRWSGERIQRHLAGEL